MFTNQPRLSAQIGNVKSDNQVDGRTICRHRAYMFYSYLYYQYIIILLLFFIVYCWHRTDIFSNSYLYVDLFYYAT